jgi:hypothetical protein
MERPPLLNKGPAHRSFTSWDDKRFKMQGSVDTALAFKSQAVLPPFFERRHELLLVARIPIDSEAYPDW